MRSLKKRTNRGVCSTLHGYDQWTFYDYSCPEDCARLKCVYGGLEFCSVGATMCDPAC